MSGKGPKLRIKIRKVPAAVMMLPAFCLRVNRSKPTDKKDHHGHR